MEAEFIRKESIFLLLLLIIAVFAGAARRLRVPYPILLTIIGGILGGLPIFPNIALDPNLVFFVFLPPLLFAAGWQLSWREFPGKLQQNSQACRRSRDLYNSCPDRCTSLALARL